MKLAIVATHPIQYHAPWFRQIAAETNIELKVFYLWNFGVTQQLDPGFGHELKWDLPLLTGYDYEFVGNVSKRPGTSRFWGIRNPSLRRAINRFAPNAILLMAYNYASLYRLLFGWSLKKPLLLRGDSHRFLIGRSLKEFARRKYVATILNRFDAFLYVGTRNKSYYEYHGVDESRLFYAPHAIDNDRYTSSGPEVREAAANWRAELGIPAANKLVVFAGKFEEKKRPLDLLEAFDRLKVPDTSLLFVGSGILEDRLRRRATHVKNVHFAPFQNQSLMPRTYAAADLFVLPSFGPHETWGLCINEAMCQGMAIIVSDHVGCAADLVTPGNGLVFPAGNIARLAECLDMALRHDELRQSWGQESLRIIKRNTYRESTAGLCRALNSVSNLKVDQSARTKSDLQTTP